jgi:FkbM family methyltransferase
MNNYSIKFITNIFSVYSKYFPLDFAKSYSTEIVRKRFMSRYNGTLEVKSMDGHKFILTFPEDYGYDTIYFYGYHEEGPTKVLTNIIKRDDIIFDLGANLGWYTTLFAKLAKKGKVHSFEPIPLVYYKLISNCVLNRVMDNVLPNQVAVGDIIKEIEMYNFPELPHGHSSISDLGRDNLNKIGCQMITLDKYVVDNNIENIDFIKCDIEGSELQMLKGFSKAFDFESPPIWLFEMNDETSNALEYSPKDILIFLRKFYDYDFYKIKRSSKKLTEMENFSDYENGDNVLCIVPEYHKRDLKLSR